MSTHEDHELKSSTNVASATFKPSSQSKPIARPRKWVHKTCGILIRTEIARERGKVIFKDDPDQRSLAIRVVGKCFGECLDIYPHARARAVRFPGQDLLHNCIGLADNKYERTMKLPPQETIDRLKAKVTETLGIEPEFGWYEVEA